jgi:hypothetical protein
VSAPAPGGAAEKATFEQLLWATAGLRAPAAFPVERPP